jgi:hypothetical protein
MKRSVVGLTMTMMLLSAASARAEFRKIDLTTLGMD